MRILAIYPYVPFPPDRGAYHRGFHLLRAIGQKFSVDLLALAEHGNGIEHEGVFREFCDRVEVVPFQHPPWEKLIPNRLANPLPTTVAHWTLPAFAKVLHDWIREGGYDAVHLFDIVLGQFLLKEHGDIPLVADRTRVDLQYQLMELRRMKFSFRARFLALENCLKLWRYERTIARRTRCEVVCGPDDERFLRRWVSRHSEIHVIPNGVDLGYFHPDAAPGVGRANLPTLLFCGAMDYNPNIDALRWYFAEMDEPLRREIPDLRVLIVGKDPVNEVRCHGSRSHVTITGGVPDVRPYYRQAWLQMVPLRIGGGTRLKIVESMAMGTPVVSTRIGAQGLDLRHEWDVLFADESSEFVRQAARGLREVALRERLERQGLQTVRSRFSWPSLGERLVRVYERIEADIERAVRRPGTVSAALS